MSSELGAPLADDGRNVFSYRGGGDIDDDLTFRYPSSPFTRKRRRFYLFGAGEWQARLISALFAFLAILLFADSLRIDFPAPRRIRRAGFGFRLLFADHSVVFAQRDLQRAGAVFRDAAFSLVFVVLRAPKNHDRVGGGVGGGRRFLCQLSDERRFCRFAVYFSFAVSPRDVRSAGVDSRRRRRRSVCRTCFVVSRFRIRPGGLSFGQARIHACRHGQNFALAFYRPQSKRHARVAGRAVVCRFARTIFVVGKILGTAVF